MTLSEAISAPDYVMVGLVDILNPSDCYSSNQRSISLFQTARDGQYMVEDEYNQVTKI